MFEYVAPNQIPTRLREATVAIEDRRFYQHGALDYQGIVRAGVKDLLGDGNALQGASTLTMQLVNNLYLDGTAYASDHNLKYKIIQAKLAQQLESKHNKPWILDSYLNAVPYGTSNGEEALGVGAAALMFFNRPVSKLNLAQMSLLAGLPQSPTHYDPIRYPAAREDPPQRGAPVDGHLALHQPGSRDRGGEAATPGPPEQPLHRRTASRTSSITSSSS